MKKITIFRKISQSFFLILFVYILWSTTYPLNGLLPPKLFFQSDPLIMVLTSISARVIVPGILFALLILFLTAILGRFFCGWICPLGTLIDMTGGFFRKFRRSLYKYVTHLRFGKYILLFLMSVFAFFGMQTIWLLDPLVISGRFFAINLLPALATSIDSFFIFLIQKFSLHGVFHDFYRTIKPSFLNINRYEFENSWLILIMFVFILSIAVFLPRFWCRTCCPLGGLFAIFARFSSLSREIAKCSDCGLCFQKCRMGAIKRDASYIKSECILCGDCIYNCPGTNTSFKWNISFKKVPSQDKKNGISRKDFLFLIGTPLLFSFSKLKKGYPALLSKYLLRPPGVKKEKKLHDLCIRCGNCMRACITNGLQPVMLESGLSGMWTPKLVPEIGYCEYNCSLCGEVCPTGAIPRLELKTKKTFSIGKAKINRKTCLAWSQNLHCIVCEEHCPIPNKAIKIIEEEKNGIMIPKPYVDKTLCIGCGICQNKCPVDPVRAIRVEREE